MNKILNLEEIKGLINQRQFPHCKKHLDQRVNYFSASKNCLDRYKPMCQFCSGESIHDGELIYNIRDFFENLINEIVQGKDECQYREKSLQNLLELRRNCKKTVDQLGKMIDELDQTITQFQKNVKNIPTNKEIILNNIQKVLLGNDWKEQTCDGITGRLKNISEVCELKIDSFKIKEQNKGSQEEFNKVRYYTNFCGSKLQEIQQKMKTIFKFSNKRFGDRSSDLFASVFEISKQDINFKMVIDSNDSNVIDKNTTQLLICQLNEQNIQQFEKYEQKLTTIYIDLIEDPQISFNQIQALNKLITLNSTSLKVLWLNLDGWHYSGNKHINLIAQSLQNLKNLNTLIINMNGFGKKSQELSLVSLGELGLALGDLSNLNKLSLWLDNWKINFSDQDLELLFDNIARLWKLDYLDLSLKKQKKQAFSNF